MGAVASRGRCSVARPTKSWLIAQSRCWFASKGGGWQRRSLFRGTLPATKNWRTSSNGRTTCRRVHIVTWNRRQCTGVLPGVRCRAVARAVVRKEHAYNDVRPVRYVRHRSHPHAHPGVGPHHPVLAAVLEGRLFALVEFAHDRAACEPDNALRSCVFELAFVEKVKAERW